MKLTKASILAQQIVIQLSPYCERIEIAGSIRRQKPEVGDIEIVAIPKVIEAGDLFGAGDDIRDPDFISSAREIGDIRKGDLRTGKYIQFWLPDPGVQVDLFLANRDNWGLILAIRTGSADFSHFILAGTWSRLGYRSIEGLLTHNGRSYPCREERDLFTTLGLKFIPPEERNL